MSQPVEESEGFEPVFTTGSAGIYALALVSATGNHEFKADAATLMFTAAPVSGTRTVLAYLGSGVVISHAGDEGELYGVRLGDEL